MRECRGGLGAVQQARETEVEQFRLSGLGQRDIAGLEVAMQESALVRVVERIADLGAEPDQIGHLDRATEQPLLQRPSRHVLHDQEVHAVLRVEVEDRRHTGMRQPRQHMRLAPESLARVRVAERAARQHLHRHIAIEVLVVRLPHHAHATLTDPFDECVVRERAALQLRHANLRGSRAV